MCLIVFAYNVHPSYRLVLAANRDEFYERPSSSADFWKDHPRVLAGRDMKEGGTWLGITKSGKFAAVTNYREPSSLKSGAPSRGRLVSSYLTGNQAPDKYLKKISSQADKYNGFNLLLGDDNNLFVFSNRGENKKLKPGIYGLSNHLLNSPWPKVARGRKMLKAALKKKGEALEEALFALLADRHVPPDNKLPSTGVGLEWERLLSPILTETQIYGTRSSTILLIGKNRRVRFVEKVFDGQKEPWITSRFSFVVRLKFQKRSTLKFVSRTIPHSGGNDTR
ncbi:MAG: NRDE family protein [Syntrophaceae bacterium]|nr:NRDE family protein [Syntrophaceae bacterium]